MCKVIWQRAASLTCPPCGCKWIRPILTTAANKNDGCSPLVQHSNDHLSWTIDNKCPNSFSKRPHRWLVPLAAANEFVRSILTSIIFAVSWTHKNQPPKRQLDRLSRYARYVRPCDQHTDTRTTLRVTPVTVGCSYAVHAMRLYNRKWEQPSIMLSWRADMDREINRPHTTIAKKINETDIPTPQRRVEGHRCRIHKVWNGFLNSILTSNQHTSLTSTASKGDSQLSTHADPTSTRRAPISPILGFWGSKVPQNGRFPALDADEPPCKIWRR